jgi:shikimate kinase
MLDDIILIGPSSTGKSTLGKLLAEELNLPQCSLDCFRWEYFKRAGYDCELAQKFANNNGVLGLIEYWKPFEADVVERVLAEHRNCVIDFGAGHSIYEDKTLFERVQKALSTYKNVVLILPSPDKAESIEVLVERKYLNYETNITLRVPTPYPDQFTDIYYKDSYAFNQASRTYLEQQVTHHSNYTLATKIIYTLNKTPQESAKEILTIIGLP